MMMGRYSHYETGSSWV